MIYEFAVPAVGNGWMRTAVGDETALGYCVRYRPTVHPVFGVLPAHGPDVPPVFHLTFQYPVQTAASYAHDAEPLAISPKLRTWHSRN